MWLSEVALSGFQGGEPGLRDGWRRDWLREGCCCEQRIGSMTQVPLVNLSSLIDDAKCYELIRQHRWPTGARCPHCDSPSVARDGHDDTQPHRQRYRCPDCQVRFDDLTGTVL